MTSTVSVTEPASTVTLAAPTETVTHQAVAETVTEVAAPETVEITQTETATVEVTHTETITEYVEAEGDSGSGVVGFYDSGDGAPQESVYYENCDAARAAGAAPVRRGDAGYASHLDRDGDGVGCE